MVDNIWQLVIFVLRDWLIMAVAAGGTVYMFYVYFKIRPIVLAPYEWLMLAINLASVAAFYLMIHHDAMREIGDLLRSRALSRILFIWLSFVFIYITNNIRKRGSRL